MFIYLKMKFKYLYIRYNTFDFDVSKNKFILMLKEKEVKIKIGSVNYKYFYEKYGPYKKFDLIVVSVDDLMENSTVKVTAICEICGAEKVMKYQPYNNQIKKGSYYCCKDCRMIKIKETNKNRYNVEFPMQRKEVMEKSKQTLLEKYNIENISQREDIRKIRSERLKNEDYQNKMLEGVISKFGIDNVSKLQSIKNQKEQTLMLNYGVTNPSQSVFLFEKSQKSGKKIKFHKNTNLYYRGTYELHFLDFCFEHKIDVIKGPSITFQYKGKKKVYHSDYFIPDHNLICEIKSNYYYNKYMDLNKIKKRETIKMGYNFIFILDKNYTNFLKLT